MINRFETDRAVQENIQVAVRIRPFLPREATSIKVWTATDTNSIVDDSGRSYQFDRVYSETAPTTLVFDELVERVIWEAMDGYSGCIFCYGQTGSGKTFTMHGNRKTMPGLVPLSIETAFSYIEETPDKEFLLRVSYIEVYNECVNDLLAPTKVNLKLQSDVRKGIVVEDLTEEVCTSAEKVYSLLMMGDANKQISSTNFNLRSSRSHSIFRLTIEAKTKGSRGVTYATANLIDLAGSESAEAHTSSASVFRKREMKFINRSLLTLSTVIMRLSDPKNTAPIPYRDSKLTRLLKPVLTGNSKVIVICNISPSSDSIDESLSTIKFAERAKKIKKIIGRNEELDSTALIEKYEQMIRDLQNRLQAKDNEIRGSVQVETDRKLVEELNKLGSQLSLKEDENSILDAKLEVLYQEKLNLASELEHLRSLILNSDKVKMSREQPTEVAKELTDSRVQLRQSIRIRNSRVSPSLNPSRDSIAEDLSMAITELNSEYGNPFGEALDIARQENSEETEHLRRQLAERDHLIAELREELARRQEEIGVLQDELGLVKTSRNKLLQQVKKMKER
mmetsp:Transcript_28644/g.50943  ORF Transcript_28644/g.50943 Transcript_28644/m.50943 type:complete len:565 (+) Transcript_28644:2870-4564(+)